MTNKNLSELISDAEFQIAYETFLIDALQLANDFAFSGYSLEWNGQTPCIMLHLKEQTVEARKSASECVRIAFNNNKKRFERSGIVPEIGVKWF